MKLTLPQVLTGGIGAILIAAAVKGVSPVTLVKNALDGKLTTDKGALIDPEEWDRNWNHETPLPPGVIPLPGNIGDPDPERSNGGNPVGLPPLPVTSPRDPSRGKVVSP